ncbi:flagellar biosynthesis protein FlhA [Tissierella sp. Yu-01]|uniref:flagellar biosynthesis protein FlhA n=1 Tax=Tissierella sp. Yu-01 TaxID=3035694 RepID=UPI00240E805C|nr:flagellar biosynthesis protein FlhA [Tissierella sp. Yu-01]WFA07883.1 flagellar biosynthesis protein FlhA [Tissierella sp. Yu-01]
MTVLLRNISNTFEKYTELIVAFVTVAIIGIIIIPLPSIFLDILLVINISIGVIVLLLTLFTKNVLEFSTFPTLLLISTMFRLSLNISATRLILSAGNAGFVIDAFANFVTGNNYVVGAVIYLIIVIVQIVVVTNGSSRVSEVSARFTLDAMPGKQMAIDADLNTGLIDEQTAKVRRNNLQREANFYGAMDGASKFTKGDAIAGIIITLINLIGGILIFAIQGMGIMEALDRFGKLTIGSGLVNLLPGLLISIASGILVTRSDDGQTFGKSVTEDLFGVSQVLMVTSVVLLIIAMVPAFPTIPFLIVAIIVGSVGYLLKENEKTEALAEMERENIRQVQPREKEVEGVTSFQVEPISVEIGYGLISLVDEGREDNLVTQITSIRRQCAQELGIIVNPIRIRDNLQLGPNEYNIKIKGNRVAGNTLYVNKYLALDPGNSDFEIEGIATKEPAFGIDALWIDENNKEKAELNGYTIVDPVTVFVTHLKEVIKENSPELLGRQEVKQLLEGIKDKYDVVVDELIPDILTLGDVQKVLQNLLRERVPIFDLVTILESLADNGITTKDIELLTEQVRHALKRTIVKNYLNMEEKLEVITIHPDLEELIGSNIQKTMSGSMPVLKPNVITKVFDNLNNTFNECLSKGMDPVLLASPRIRVAFRNLISFNFPNMAVLSINEVPNDIEIEAVGLVNNI